MPTQSMGDKRAQLVQLEPFLHQVGGHTSVIRFDDFTIGKPLISRERHFYETIPTDLQQFTPQYKGVSEVTVQQHNGRMFLLTHQQLNARKRWSNTSSSDAEDGAVQSDPELQSPHSSNEQLEAISRCNSVSEPKRSQHHRSGSLDSQTTPRADCNPWSLRLHNSHLEKMSKNSSQSFKFILLENLTSDFILPCILDLKMGTRLHGDDASEEKRNRQQMKCEQSTSKSLGFRIGGMQVYQRNKLLNYDKYRGRALDIDGVKHALIQFLHNGICLLTPLIAPLIARLRKLREVLARQNTFRFYSSSLLIMYDGYEWTDIGREEMQSCAEDGDSNDSTNSTASQEEAKQSDDIPHVPYRIDVRMIDFAHVTFQGFNERDIIHSGPDHGYLFGLEKLIETLEEISLRDSDL